MTKVSAKGVGSNGALTGGDATTTIYNTEITVAAAVVTLKVTITAPIAAADNYAAKTDQNAALFVGFCYRIAADWKDSICAYFYQTGNDKTAALAKFAV